MGISIVKLRGVAEKYGMTIPELLNEIIEGYNKPEEERTIHINNLEKIPLSQLQKLYRDYQEREPKKQSKKSWDLDKDTKQEVQIKTSEKSKEMSQIDEFFEFVKKHTGNFSYLLENRETVEALGKRGQFPKVSKEEREQYFKLQHLLEIIDKQQGMGEEELINKAIITGKCNPTEMKILNARLESIKREKDSREIK